MSNDLLHADGSLDLGRVREHLGRELAGIVHRHEKIQDHLQNVDREMPDDWQEAAQLVENDEVLEALETSSRARIEGLRFALRRLDAGTYEACVRCGEAINPRRLAALPVTSLCVACAAQG